jgi:hypothetical protein
VALAGCSGTSQGNAGHGGRCDGSTNPDAALDKAASLIATSLSSVVCLGNNGSTAEKANHRFGVDEWWGRGPMRLS